MPYTTVTSAVTVTASSNPTVVIVTATLDASQASAYSAQPTGIPTNVPATSSVPTSSASSTAGSAGSKGGISNAALVGAVAGGILGGIAFFTIVIVLFCLMRRRPNHKVAAAGGGSIRSRNKRSGRAREKASTQPVWPKVKETAERAAEALAISSGEIAHRIAVASRMRGRSEKVASEADDDTEDGAGKSGSGGKGGGFVVIRPKRPLRRGSSTHGLLSANNDGPASSHNDGPASSSINGNRFSWLSGNPASGSYEHLDQQTFEMASAGPSEGRVGPLGSPSGHSMARLGSAGSASIGAVSTQHGPERSSSRQSGAAMDDSMAKRTTSAASSQSISIPPVSLSRPSSAGMSSATVHARQPSTAALGNPAYSTSAAAYAIPPLAAFNAPRDKNTAPQRGVPPQRPPAAGQPEWESTLYTIPGSISERTFTTDSSVAGSVARHGDVTTGAPRLPSIPASSPLIIHGSPPATDKTNANGKWPSASATTAVPGTHVSSRSKSTGEGTLESNATFNTYTGHKKSDLHVVGTTSTQVSSSLSPIASQFEYLADRADADGDATPAADRTASRLAPAGHPRQSWSVDSEGLEFWLSSGTNSSANSRDKLSSRLGQGADGTGAPARPGLRGERSSSGTMSKNGTRLVEIFEEGSAEEAASAAQPPPPDAAEAARGSPRQSARPVTPLTSLPTAGSPLSVQAPMAQAPLPQPAGAAPSKQLARPSSRDSTNALANPNTSSDFFSPSTFSQPLAVTGAPSPSPFGSAAPPAMVTPAAGAWHPGPSSPAAPPPAVAATPQSAPMRESPSSKGFFSRAKGKKDKEPSASGKGNEVDIDALF